MEKYCEEYVKHMFSEEERAELAVEMARGVSELASAEDNKKAAMSQMKAEIDLLSAKVASAAEKINSGYEMRRIKCRMEPDYRAMVWNIYREDTGELLKSRRMSPDETQMQIDEVA